MQKYKLIIADDEAYIRRSLESFVNWNELGFEVVFLAQDGDEVIEKLKHSEVDAVLCDIQMKEVSGLQVAAFAHAHTPETKIVLISGYQEFEFARKSIEYEVFDYLLKPINIQTVSQTFAALKLALDKSNQEKASKALAKQKLAEYRDAATEKMFELISVGILATAEDCHRYLQQFKLNEGFEKVLCHRLQLQFDNLDKVDLQTSRIQSIFKSFETEYHMQDTYVFYTAQENRFDVIQFSMAPLAESEMARYCAYITTAFYNVCGANVQVAVKASGEAITDFAKKMAAENLNDQIGRGEKSAINYPEMLARQYLIILNMTTNINETAKRITKSYFEQITGNQAQALATMAGIFNQMQKLMKNQYEEIQFAAMPAYEKGTDPETYFEQQMQYFYDLLALNNENRLSTVDHAKRLIIDNISRNVSLKEAADSVFLSPNYFSRIFKEQTGENFIDYSIRVKMEMAASLLKEEPWKKIYQVSEYLGYKNIKYFYKLFKRIFDCTPSEYKKRFVTAQGETL